MMIKNHLGPYLLVFYSGGTWGITFSLARIATEGGAHPLGLTFWQTFGGGLTLLAVCAARGKWPVLDRRHLFIYLIIGSIGSLIPGTLFFMAAAHVPAGVLAITVATVPLMTYGASWLLRIDSFSPKRISGILVGLLAIILLVGPEGSLPDPAMAGWILLVLLASVFYTVENLYVDIRIPVGTDMVALLAGSLIVGGILILPAVLYIDAFVPLTVAWGRVEWSVTAMAAIGSVAYMVFLTVVKSSGAVFASQTGYIVTLSGVAWGIVIFDETHSVWVWGSLGLIMAGLTLVTPRERELGRRAQETGLGNKAEPPA
ncbi:DMT family transporter [Pseudomonadota bacterium]